MYARISTYMYIRVYTSFARSRLAADDETSGHSPQPQALVLCIADGTQHPLHNSVLFPRFNFTLNLCTHLYSIVFHHTVISRVYN